VASTPQLVADHIVDETCNELCTQVVQRKPKENASVIKEQLLKIAPNCEGFAVSMDYKLVHEGR